MSRLIIVSNRLPFTLRQRGTSIESKPSSGGLVTALGAYVARQRERDPAFESLWVGWPGSDFEPEVQPKVEAALAEQHAKPIFLSKEDSDDFYYGFCNRTLWPLFHYFTSFVDYEPRLWETYVRVNRVFRGGSWGIAASRCRSAYRVWNKPGYRDYTLGFRVALAPAD